MYEHEYEKAFENKLGPGPAAYSKIDIPFDNITMLREKSASSIRKSPSVEGRNSS